MGDMVGRKWGLIMSCLVFCVGVSLQLDTRWITFIVGRVIAGFGVVCKPLDSSLLFPISDISRIVGFGVMPRPHVPIRGKFLSLDFPSP